MRRFILALVSALSIFKRFGISKPAKKKKYVEGQADKIYPHF